MSALKTHPDDRTRWIPIDVASQLLGKSEGHLRRLTSDLATKGQATKLKTNGTWKWHIAASYSPRLIRQAIETDDDGRSEFNELLKTTPQDKIERAQVDAQILIEFRSLRAKGSFDIDTFKQAMIEKHDRSLGKSRLYKMDSECPPSTDFEGIVVSLIDRRGRRKGDIKSCSDVAWQHFCTFYLTQNQLSLSKCHRMVDGLAKDNGWAWPSESRIRELVNERLDPATLTLKREGLDAWNRRHLAPMEQDPNAWDAGQCWEGDHSVLDFHIRVIKDGKWTRTRPQLTAWIDRRTRMLVGYHLSEQGNAYTIRLALLNALKDKEITPPEIVWMDNGKDFMAQSIGGMTKGKRRKSTRAEIDQAQQQSAGLLSMLGITPHFALPYNHNGKPRVERFFGTVHGEFDKEFPSYSGFKPGMLDHRDQLKMQSDIMSMPTLEDVRRKFAQFANWYNHRADHAIDDLRDPDTLERLSPTEFYTRYLPAKRAVKQDALKLLEPIWSTPLKVHKWGISLRIGPNTVRYGELEPELESLVGTDHKVFVSWNPDDTTQVTVWSEDFKYICIAPENGRYGGLAQDRVTKQDRSTAFNLRREQRRRAKAKVDYISASLSDVELASKATRDREVGETKARMAEFDRTRDPNDTPPLRLVHTRLEDAPKDIEAQQQRKAAGAELMNDNEYGSLIDAIKDKFGPKTVADVPSRSNDESYSSLLIQNTSISPSTDEDEDDFESYGSLLNSGNESLTINDQDDEEPFMRLVDHLR